MSPIPRQRIFAACLLLILVTATGAHGLGEQRYVSPTLNKGGFTLAASGKAAPIEVAPNDYPGVIRAAHDLQADIERVTGMSPQFLTGKGESKGEAVLIGTIGRSPLIDRLIRERKIDVSEIQGKWECTLVQVVDKPLPGVSRALVIAGSDKRGTIYGLYDISEQIGVSPWYWWADVPVPHKDALYIEAGRYVHGEPAVKYRGIFLNDEAPALSGWTHDTFGGMNHHFYAKVFELLLRLHANYLWPAMWGNAFNEDDPENPKLADEYGIVMGTSHHEPMLRAQQEWKRHGTGPWDYSTNFAVLDKFWTEGIERNKNYESTITIGMRGDGDMPMTEGQNISLLEKIVTDQRKIIADHLTPTLASDPQVWSLYKEVQAYYEKGMRVPDDVTLLWCDDNWGNIRRLPTPEERKRPGGAGIYYHFDYVGDPRNYKWIDTNPIPKVWEQMNLALNYGATRIWVVNVGDLKPMEFPIEFFLDFARDPQRWDKDHLQEFTRLWAKRDFGPEHANEIADLVSTELKYQGRRKPELLDPDIYSLTNYNEADRVEQEWKALLAKAEELQEQIPADKQDAYFELVLHPIKAPTIVNEMYIAAGRNHLYAKQGRAETNDYAARVHALFQADADLTSEYNHVLAHGKWNHMMDQTHLGYWYWQQPPANAMPQVTEVQPLPEPQMGISIEGAVAPFGPPQLDFDNYQRQTHFIDIFNRGTGSFRFTAAASEPWIVLSDTSGEVSKSQRLLVQVDWDKAPASHADGVVTIASGNNPPIKVHVSAFKPETPARDALEGFVESDGYVSIEAAHYTSIARAGDLHWDRIPDYGLTDSGMTVFPVTAASVLPPQPTATLEYRMYLFDKGDFTLQTTFGPSLNFVPGRGLRFTVALDNQQPQIVDMLEHNTDKDWAKAVSDEVRRVETKLNIDQPGYHTLKIGVVDPGVVLEKLVLSAGPLKPSYLGPPESFHGALTSVR